MPLDLAVQQLRHHLQSTPGTYFAEVIPLEIEWAFSGQILRCWPMFVLVCLPGCAAVNYVR
jgi:hypothetical protein